MMKARLLGNSLENKQSGAEGSRAPGEMLGEPV